MEKSINIISEEFNNLIKASQKLNALYEIAKKNKSLTQEKLDYFSYGLDALDNATEILRLITSKA